MLPLPVVDAHPHLEPLVTDGPFVTDRPSRSSTSVPAGANYAEAFEVRVGFEFKLAEMELLHYRLRQAIPGPADVA